MATKTKIAWCDHTFNPWIGCSKVSPGCAHCYAEADFDHRKHFAKWGPGNPRHRTSAATWRQPLKWNRDGQGPTPGDDPLRRPRVFCASLADWLDDEVPIEWLADLLDLIRRTPNLNWLLLTKRPQNWQTRIEAIKTSNDNLAAWLLGWILPAGEIPSGERTPIPLENVWVGVSVEDQKWADERIPILLTIPAKVRFVSYEPALGLVDFEAIDADGLYRVDALRGAAFVDGHNEPFEGPKVDWIIVGGESGPSARPCDVAWVRFILKQCQGAGVACFVKQLGSKAIHDLRGMVPLQPAGADPDDVADFENHFANMPAGFKHPKGGDPDEWPQDLRVREFP